MDKNAQKKGHFKTRSSYLPLLFPDFARFIKQRF